MPSGVMKQAEQTGAVASAPAFSLELTELRERREAMYPAPRYRRPWNHAELLSILPASGVRVLDVGAPATTRFAFERRMSCSQRISSRRRGPK